MSLGGTNWLLDEQTWMIVDQIHVAVVTQTREVVSYLRSC